MFRECPLLFGYDLMSITKKISFYKENNLEEYILDNSKILIYNLDYIKGRFNYLLNNNIDNKEDLFISEKEFYDKYNVNSLDLIKE